MPKKKVPIWARTDIWFDGTETIGAKPIREVLADRAAEQRAGEEDGKKEVRRTAGNNDDFYTVAQLARKWNLSEDVIRKEFENEAGVLKLARARKGKRRYKTLRIPAEVAERVRRRMSA
jgi:hypothetical protein